MKKIWICAVLLTLTMGACGSGDSSQEAEPDNQSTRQAPATESPESEIPAGERLDYPETEVKFQPPPASVGLPEGVQVALLERNPMAFGPFTMRLKFPAGSRFLPHTHPVTSRITVISGTFNYGMGRTFDKSATKTLKGGESLIDLKGMPHFVSFDEETVVQLRAMGPFGIDYVNPADDPRSS